MERSKLVELIRSKRSFLCIGLDSDPDKIPAVLRDTEDPVFEFNRAIIDSTHDLAVAYKPNLAFYECVGSKGWESLTKTIRYLNDRYADQVFTIADAKRGDIGNTSKQYARAFFDPSSSGMAFDAVTVAPYMGEDSVKPFLSFADKWIIVLALTSNPGADDFQFFRSTNRRLFEEVLTRSKAWGSENNTMFVVGATRPEMLREIRSIVPRHFLLVPGVGAQGGSLSEVAANGLTDDCGLIVNSSRNIIFASSGPDFAEAARAGARIMQQEMESILSSRGI